MSKVVTRFSYGMAEVIWVKGTCKVHGRAEVDYDDFEELGIEEEKTL